MRELITSLVDSQPDLAVCGAAGSGEEALRVIPSLSCDLALVDLMMPGMNGLDLLGELQVAAPELPCLVVSAQPESLYATRAVTAGARGFVPKGDPGALLAAIREVLH